jgi:BirA family biotin operon repressor/biotin-[acetyl-CoA-carboxylase] ligase
MDVASQLARFGARERTVVVSTAQTAGRGRGGRAWQAPAGSAVFATLILRPRVAAQRLSTLSLVAGVAAAEAIEDMVHRSVWLKWPNDVLLQVAGDTSKVAGILVTSRLRGDSVESTLVGIGINVLGGAEDLPSGATSIHAATGVTVTPDEVLQRLLDRFSDAYADFVAADGRPSLAGWLARASFLGEVVTVEDACRSLTGTYLGVDQDGGLLLDVPGGPVRKLVAGDLVRGPRAVAQSG